MSASQSNLSSAQFGYDVVVATTQTAVNATMLQFINETTMPVVAMYYNQDDNGNPVLVDRDTLLTQTNGTDPLTVPSWTSSDAVTQDITNITNSDFWYAFQAQIGMAPGYLPADLPDMVSLVPGSQSATFSLMCSEFTIVEATFGRTGLESYLNTSQPSGDAWLFTSSVPLQNITADSNIPSAVQKQLDNLGAEAFSIQQLYYDLDNALLESTPTISGVSAGSAVYTALNEVFLGAYFSAMQTNGQPVLGYSIVPNSPTTDPSPLQLSSMNIEVSPYTPPSGGTSNSDLNTLNYLCATDGDKLPASVEFTWNWIEADEESLYDGVISVNRNTLAKYFEQQLYNTMLPNCLLPAVRVWLTDADTECNWQYSMTSDQTPTVTYPTSGAIVLSFAYSGPKAFDQAGLDGDMGQGALSSQYTVDVEFTGNTIVITQSLVVWLMVSSLSDKTSGNVVDTTIVDTYTIAVNDQGGLTVSDPASQTTNNSVTLSTNSFENFFNGLNSIDADVTSWVQNYVATNLTDIPASQLRDFIFPGGAVFTYTDVSFSENQDLVSHINYVDPS